MSAVGVEDGVAVSEPVVARTRAELDTALAALPDRRFVATMGALHAGHAALLSAAGPGAVLSIFVNPLQFGPDEDLDRYPRTFDEDLELAAAHGVAVVWAPTVDVMYPHGTPTVSIKAGPLGDLYEGAARPGHFDGVLTVVAKLFGQIQPDVAYFGQKDAQQLALVRTMVRDLDMGVRVDEVPTVRESDGLALSSRNRYLDPVQREAALAISRALKTGDLEAARAEIAAEPRLNLDYAELVDPLTFEPATGPTGRLIITAYSGPTRLLDNAVVDISLLDPATTASASTASAITDSAITDTASAHPHPHQEP
jgi:pantoate--beta-alanine ligase